MMGMFVIRAFDNQHVQWLCMLLTEGAKNVFKHVSADGKNMVCMRSLCPCDLIARRLPFSR